VSGRFRPEFTLEVEHRIYLDGIRLFNQGDFFEAHDAWEEAWHEVQHPLRDSFYRGLIQTAVTLELLRRGRAVGVRQVFVSAAELWRRLPATFMGIDLQEHLANVRRAIEPALSDLQATHVAIDPTRLFAIELLYNPFVESRHGEQADGKS